MKLNLNLATRPYVNRRKLLISYLLLLLLLVGAGVLLFTMILHTQRRTAEVTVRIAELQQRSALGQPVPGVGAFTPAAQAELDLHITFANQLLERDHYHWTELLDQLEAATLTGISIRGLKPEFKDGLVNISGVAADLGRLQQFIDRLTASRHFRDVLLLQQGKQKQAGSEDELTFSLSLRRGGVR